MCRNAPSVSAWVMVTGCQQTQQLQSHPEDILFPPTMFRAVGATARRLVARASETFHCAGARDCKAEGHGLLQPLPAISRRRQQQVHVLFISTYACSWHPKRVSACRRHCRYLWRSSSSRKHGKRLLPRWTTCWGMPGRSGRGRRAMLSTFASARRRSYQPMPHHGVRNCP